MTHRPEISIAIACGGTGGHLFPGIAVGEQLVERGCSVSLFVSAKDVDQEAVRSVRGMEVVTLPAVGLSQGRYIAFLRGFIQSYRASKKQFQARRPDAALAMGGFTSAPPVLAAKRFGARTFLHESNIVAGKANRWLALVVNEVFVGFEKAAGRLQHRQVRLTGTPVRKQFQQRDSYPCRVALGLDPSRPVLLVMGGSQGAAGINQLIEKTLPLLVQEAPELQLLHLTGPRDAQTISRTCASLGLKAVVHPFFNEMELVLGAATVAVSRAGASSMAELAAMRVPAVLVPFPAATDNHQLLNARAFQETGAACVAEQSDATPESLSRQILDLVTKPGLRHRIQQALASWHAPKAAEMIADEILRNTRPRRVEIHCGCEKGECGCSSPEPGARRNVTLA